MSFFRLTARSLSELSARIRFAPHSSCLLPSRNWITGAGEDWAFGSGAARLDDRGTASNNDDLWLSYPQFEGTSAVI